MIIAGDSDSSIPGAGFDLFIIVVLVETYIRASAACLSRRRDRVDVAFQNLIESSVTDRLTTLYPLKYSLSPVGFIVSKL